MTYRVRVEPAGGGSKFFYHIEGPGFRSMGDVRFGPWLTPMGGLSHEPLLDACRQLKRMGADPTALAALFHGDSTVWAVRCPIGKGAALTAGEGYFRQYRPKATPIHPDEVGGWWPDA